MGMKIRLKEVFFTDGASKMEIRGVLLSGLPQGKYMACLVMFEDPNKPGAIATRQMSMEALAYQNMIANGREVCFQEVESVGDAGQGSFSRLIIPGGAG